MQNLGVLAAGETASADDSDIVGKAVDNTYAEMRRLRLVANNWATSAIPDNVFEAFAEMVEPRVAQSFGRPRDEGLIERAIQRMRRQVVEKPSGERVQALYF